MPEGWIRFEATYTEAVHACGAPTPRVVGIETIDGREVSIYERVHGQSMWDAVRDAPADASRFGSELADLQRRLLTLTPPITIPLQFTRLNCKIREAARTIDVTLAEILRTLPKRSERMRLCHGDLHPKNIILSPDGPVVVDWFDVSRGDACGDVARTSLLLSTNATKSADAAVDHLPGASPSVLRELHDAYLASMVQECSLTDAELQAWLVIEAAARLAEGVEPGPLLAVIAQHGV